MKFLIALVLLWSVPSFGQDYGGEKNYEVTMKLSDRKRGLFLAVEFKDLKGMFFKSNVSYDRYLSLEQILALDGDLNKISKGIILNVRMLYSEPEWKNKIGFTYRTDAGREVKFYF